MGPVWQTFVEQAIAGEHDDPFVGMLRRQIAAGSRVVRIHIELASKAPEYRVLLERLRQLSELRIPHSPSFTRWSLEISARLASTEEEEQRFALVAGDRFEPIMEELGRDYADAILIERLHALRPPRTTAVLARGQIIPTAPGQARKRASRWIDGFLQSMVGDLGKALRYSNKEAASILDGALERFALDRFHLPAEPRSLQSVG